MVKQKKKAAIQLMLLAGGAIMVIQGISRGEVTVMFHKAVNICLECIGIG